MSKPEIRLKGFNGEWIKTPLARIAKFSKGRGYSKMDLRPNGSPIILYGRLYTNYETVINDVDTFVETKDNSVLSKGGEIIIPASGETPEDIACASVVSKIGVILGGDLNVLSIDSSSYNKAFTALAISYGTVHKELAKYAQGKTVVHLHNSDISKVTICYPDNEIEQKSISDYFKSLNSMIQTTTKKILSLKQLKSASLISMFPQAGETKPRLRFRGFDGEWEKAKLNKYAFRITRKNTHLESTLPLTISAAEGLISQTAFFNNVVASSNVSGYYLVRNGEFAYNKSYSNGYPFGAVKRLDKYDMGVLSTLYIVFALNNMVDSDYIVQYFNTNLWHNEVAIRAAEGARNHGLLNISAEDFLDIDIVLPQDIVEQKKIASFFASLDKQISLQEQRLEKLKQIKAACLDKMFV